MSKPINHDLLWKVIVWVQWQHATLLPLEQSVRPQRAYQANDGKILGPLILAVRTAYHADKVELGKSASFEKCKTQVVSNFQKRHGLNDPTRNFFSSVVATYIAWDRYTVPKEASPILAILVPFSKYNQGV